jgi:hypothetical protein
MKTFHICFYLVKDYNSTVGINIEAETIEIALKIFKEKFPMSEISYIQNKSI